MGGAAGGSVTKATHTLAALHVQLLVRTAHICREYVCRGVRERNRGSNKGECLIRLTTEGGTLLKHGLTSPARELGEPAGTTHDVTLFTATGRQNGD